MSDHENVITIGIPCYRDVPGEVLEDYMRFAFHLGRRYGKWEFRLGIKTKSEQFRARNAIVEAALQINSKYVLMLDDDHVIDPDGSAVPSRNYDFLKTLVSHMEENPDIGLVGALYYQRGGDCRPVLMKEGARGGGFYWMRDDEIGHGLIDVDVQGGGCMLIRCEALLKAEQPWFQPEFEHGTDVQICQKIKNAGYRVCCDTSLELGHILAQRKVITGKNRHEIWGNTVARRSNVKEGVERKWLEDTAINLYKMDIEEYLGIGPDEIQTLATQYAKKNFPAFETAANKKDYYLSLGKEQIARQYMFHLSNPMVDQMRLLLKIIDTNVHSVGLDYGCGTAPVGFELAMRGHHIDFVDIEGTQSYEFAKWRAHRRNILHKVGWEIAGPYDYILLLDVIEHLEDPETVLRELVSTMKDGAAILTNYWNCGDITNPEHIMMDKDRVKKILTECGVYPINPMFWLKHDMPAARTAP